MFPKKSQSNFPSKESLCVNSVQFLTNCFLLYINPVFEKQIKPAKNNLLLKSMYMKCNNSSTMLILNTGA